MNNKINLETIIKKEFEEKRASAFSHHDSSEVSDILKEYLTDEISQAITVLKRIISKNAGIYRNIIDIVPVLFDDVFSMLEEMNKEDEVEDLTVDYSNFHKKLLTMPIVSNKELEYVDADGKTVNLFESGKIECVRNNYIEVLYSKKENGSNKYKVGTYSPFYTYYIFKNNDLVLADNLSFDNYNKLVTIGNEMYGIITESAKYSSYITQQKILFSYLAERGTGLKFKFLLYKYSQQFFTELSEHSFEKNALDFAVKDYIYYFTMFRTVCMFPDDEFFSKVHKIVSHLIKSRTELIKENKYDTDLKNEAVFQICEGQICKILEELFSYQTNAVLSKNTENTDKEIFSFFKFKNSKDRTIQHVKLWKEVQYFVNKHIKSDYTTDYFDIRPNNNVNSYKSLITFDNALKIRSFQI